MRIAPLAISALAAQALAKDPLPPCNASSGIDHVPLWGGLGGKYVKPIRDVMASLVEPFHEVEARALQGYTNLGTRWNKCLDVTAGSFNPGTHLQIWECGSGNKNQAVKFSGGNLRFANNFCMDLPGGITYPGVELQLWPCQTGNANQLFELVGMNVRFKGSNFCLDVKDGRYDSGRAPVLYPCYWEQNADVGNQHWWVGGQPRRAGGAAGAQAPQVATPMGDAKFAGAPVVSIDTFCNIHPECAPYKQAFVSAGVAKGIHPTLIAAVAMQESSCRPTVNQWGLMQFSSDASWNAYKGSPSANKLNPYDAAWAGAEYLKVLLNNHGWNLDAALREYNGPIANGGKPSYQYEIRLWMKGQSPY